MFEQILTADDPRVADYRGVSDPELLRSRNLFIADVVMLSPTCCDPLYRKAIRTSMGATLRVPFVQLGEWPAALPRLRAAGFRLVALTPREPSEPLDTFASRLRPPKLALLVGAGGHGLTAAVESAADERVRIPIARGIDSLNLAVATGIALEQLTRNIRGRGILAAQKTQE